MFSSLSFGQLGDYLRLILFCMVYKKITLKNIFSGSFFQFELFIEILPKAVFTDNSQV
jgi:hypothetical protein